MKYTNNDSLMNIHQATLKPSNSQISFEQKPYHQDRGEDEALFDMIQDQQYQVESHDLRPNSPEV
jgi:hypothetical protein